MTYLAGRFFNNKINLKRPDFRPLHSILWHMDYYFMNDSADLKIIGKNYPQLEKMYDGFNYGHLYAAWGLDPAWCPNPMTKLTGFQLKYHSKVTDWISFVALGFGATLVSDRFYSLMQQYNCMKSLCVDSEVEHHGKTYPYKFLYFPDNYPQFIDFNKTRFYIGSTANGWEADVEIGSLDEHLALTQRLQEERKATGKIRSVKILELFMKPPQDTLDWFRLPMVVHYVVSARLREAIETHNITGVQFEPAQGHKFVVNDYSVMPPRVVE